MIQVSGDPLKWTPGMNGAWPSGASVTTTAPAATFTLDPGARTLIGAELGLSSWLACDSGVRRCATGASHPPARRKYSVTISQCCSSLECSQPRIALVGKHRFEKVHANTPPGRTTRARSVNTSTGRTR